MPAGPLWLLHRSAADQWNADRSPAPGHGDRRTPVRHSQNFPEPCDASCGREGRRRMTGRLRNQPNGRKRHTQTQTQELLRKNANKKCHITNNDKDSYENTSMSKAYRLNVRWHTHSGTKDSLYLTLNHHIHLKPGTQGAKLPINIQMCLS